MIAAPPASAQFGYGAPGTGPGREVGRTKRARATVSGFNSRHKGRYDLRAPKGGIGVQANHRSRTKAAGVAKAFLEENAVPLGLDPNQLRLELARSFGPLHHLLFEQVVDGVKVEMSRVKVHLALDGEVVSVQSNFVPGLKGPGVPAIGETEAAGRAAADAGAVRLPRNGVLVYLPAPGNGPVRLAWKFRIPGQGAAWYTYVDAATGDILLRYDDLRKICVTSGTVMGMVYDLDKRTAAVARPMEFQKVFIKDAESFAVTGSTGFFCHSTAFGKIFTALQGPFANVANFKGGNAHYDNASGAWSTFSTPYTTPHPYANNQVLIATITVGASGAVRVMPVFSNFDVGDLQVDFGELFVGDDDQAAVLGPDGAVYGSYIGQRSNFNGPSVPGSSYRVRLKTNESGTQDGFTINISSYLTLTNASVPDNKTATFTWTAGHTTDNSEDEINLFYHTNKMYKYFAEGVNAGGFADIAKPVPIMAHLGPNLANAFYDPFHGSLNFGDTFDAFAFDATVIHHEYVHFAIDQIYPIINLGQFGAISEALADYFAGSSLENSSIGLYTNLKFGNSGPLRELNCPDPNSPCHILYPVDWQGEVHDDSRMVSQALWEIRADLKTQIGASNGIACADGLAFQSLFFFPDSFVDFLDAMLTVESRADTRPAACAAATLLKGKIEQKFTEHGINLNESDADVYEPNDGIASATDITTATVVTGRIYPKGDLDYYAFGAGPGSIKIRLQLPANPASQGTYFAHTVSLVDRQFNIVAEAAPTIDVNPAIFGGCDEPAPPGIDICQTSQSEVVLQYANAADEEFFVLVAAPPGANGLVSGNATTEFYSLRADYNRTGPVATDIVTAKFDGDVMDFGVFVTSFTTHQGYEFHHAQLRDHALSVLPNTAASAPNSTFTYVSPYFSFVSTSASAGKITGRMKLTPGFDSRFPGVGTVHLEVFGVNRLGHLQSFGFSPAMNLTTNRPELTLFNNIFNPRKGQRATIRYEVMEAGRVSLRLYTLDGRLAATLLDASMPAGKGSLDWGGGNLQGTTVASGIYYLHMEGPGISKTKKIVVVK